MKTAVETREAHVVRGRGGRVVLILWGEEAEAEAASWAARGYDVQATDRGLISV